MPHIPRTRFAKEIVAEFLPPSNRQKIKGDKVVIICSGMPMLPRKGAGGLMEFFARKGYWVFYPRYRGSWESGGSFLRFSPEKDIKDIIDQLPKGFVSAGMKASERKRYRVDPRTIVLVAGSFGGPAGILMSRDKRVSRVIAISPVVDWKAHIKGGETIDAMYPFTQEAFGKGYRMTRTNWNKLKTGQFYNPMPHWQEIDGRKLFIVHAKDDDSVPWKDVAKFAKLTGAPLKLLNRGGHLSSATIMSPRYYPAIQRFLKQK